MSLKINGQDLRENRDFEFINQGMDLKIGYSKNLSSFDLECETKIFPQKNLALEGFYKSDDIVLCSQCEPEGEFCFHLSNKNLKYILYPKKALEELLFSWTDLTSNPFILLL